MVDRGQFPAVFAQLKALFRPVAASLVITEDTAVTYSLSAPAAPRFPKGFWVGGVQVKKNSVSYHLMPVYMYPDGLADLSEPLKKRMQGKSCFNFTTTDDALMAELGRLTVAGFERARQALSLSPEQ